MAHIKIKYHVLMCDYNNQPAPTYCGEGCEYFTEKRERDESGFLTVGVCKHEGDILKNALEFDTKNYTYKQEYIDGLITDVFTSKKTGTVYPEFLQIDNDILCGDPDRKEG